MGLKPHDIEALGAIAPLFLFHYTPLMDFTQHQFQQQAAAIQSQLLAIRERLDSLEQARAIDQALVIITEDGNAIPWTDQPLTHIPFDSRFRVFLGSEWISEQLPLDRAKSLIQACLAHRLAGNKTFNVKEYLDG